MDAENKERGPSIRSRAVALARLDAPSHLFREAEMARLGLRSLVNMAPKQRYKKMSLWCHPDKAADSNEARADANEAFKLLGNAWVEFEKVTSAELRAFRASSWRFHEEVQLAAAWCIEQKLPPPPEFAGPPADPDAGIPKDAPGKKGKKGKHAAEEEDLGKMGFWGVALGCTACALGCTAHALGCTAANTDRSSSRSR